MTEIVTRPAQNNGTLALRGDQADWTDTQRAALAQIGVDDAPAGDQQVFLHVAQRSGLDPFAKQIYMIRRWDPQTGKDKWTIQTGINGYRVIAQRRKEYAGQLEPQWCGKDGVWREVWTADDPPVAARIGVIRHDWPNPAWGVAHFREFAATKKGGELTHMWVTMSCNQISKCAEAAALRRAFPQDFAGIYTDDEMEHLDNPQPRVVIDQHRDQPTEPDWDALIERHEMAGDRDELAKLWNLARGMRPNDGALFERIAQAGERAAYAKAQNGQPEPATSDPAADAATQDPKPSQMRKLFGLLDKHDVKGDEARHRVASHALDRDIASFKELTANDVSRLITHLERRDVAADGGGSS